MKIESVTASGMRSKNNHEKRKKQMGREAATISGEYFLFARKSKQTRNQSTKSSEESNKYTVEIEIEIQYG